MKKIQAGIITGVFCAAILGMGAVTALKPQKAFSENENRSLKQKPAFSLSALVSGTFAQDYDSYLSDQFIARDQWIGIKTTAERATGKQESNDIYFAKDDYLIEKHSGSFDTDTAKSNIGYLQNFIQKQAQSYGAEHVTCMVVPNAVCVLKDKLPWMAAPYDEMDYLQQIQSQIPQASWLDANAVLKEHKEEEIFYRTDHHWKTLGAFYLYQAFAASKGFEVPSEDAYQISTITEDFSGTIASKINNTTILDSIQIYEPIKPKAYTVNYVSEGIESDTWFNKDYLETKDQYAVFAGGNHALINVTAKENGDGKLLVIKDSYANCFLPFLFSDFGEIDVVDLRYYNQPLSELMASKAYTDILFLYNTSGFAEDPSIAKLQN